MFCGIFKILPTHQDTMQASRSARAVILRDDHAAPYRGRGLRRIARRLNQTFGAQILGLIEPFVVLTARCWRTLLWRTTVIGVTGSVGKTTAKESIAGILSTHGRTFKSYRNQNGGLSVALNVLRIRPWHRYAVLEIATTQAGEMLRATRIARPDIRVVLNVKSTHTNFFLTLDDIAREKAQFLAGIGRKQIAVINVDDSRVAKMSEGKSCGVATFGVASTADLQASLSSSVWPSRLSFKARHGNESANVETQLVGEHWIPSALASIAVAVECGMNLTDAAAALQQVEPFPGRMQPVQVPSGAIFLRDDYLNSLGTLGPALKVLKDAGAERKVIVISDLMDAPHTSPRERQRQMGYDCAQVADLLVFVSAAAEHAASGAIDADRIHSFKDRQQAADYLRTELRDGDLVLLKGETRDHLARLFFEQLGKVSCWKNICGKNMLCDICWELGLPPSDMGKGVVITAPAKQLSAP